jgi:hypothetical protein
VYSIVELLAIDFPLQVQWIETHSSFIIGKYHQHKRGREDSPPHASTPNFVSPGTGRHFPMWNEHDTFTSRTCFGTRRPSGLQYSSGGPGAKYVTGDVPIAVVQHASILKARLYKTEQISDQESFTVAGAYRVLGAGLRRTFGSVRIYTASFWLKRQVSMSERAAIARRRYPALSVC